MEITAVGDCVEISTVKLKSANNKITIWTKERHIALNESKLANMDFIYKSILKK